MSLYPGSWWYEQGIRWHMTQQELSWTTTSLFVFHHHQHHFYIVDFSSCSLMFMEMRTFPSHHHSFSFSIHFKWKKRIAVYFTQTSKIENRQPTHQSVFWVDWTTFFHSNEYQINDTVIEDDIAWISSFSSLLFNSTKHDTLSTSNFIRAFAVTAQNWNSHHLFTPFPPSYSLEIIVYQWIHPSTMKCERIIEVKGKRIYINKLSSWACRRGREAKREKPKIEVC